MSDSKKARSSSKKQKGDLKKKKHEHKKEKAAAAKEEVIDESKSTEKKQRRSKKKDKVADIGSSSTSRVVSVGESKISDKKSRRSKKKGKAPNIESSSDKESEVESVDESITSDEEPKVSRKKEKAFDTESDSDKESEVESVDESITSVEEHKVSKKKERAFNIESDSDKESEVESVDESIASDEEPKKSRKKAKAPYTNGNGVEATEDIRAPKRGKRKNQKDEGDKKSSRKEKTGKSKEIDIKGSDWHPAVHPKLSNVRFPVYFVNKHGDLVSNAAGELVPVAPREKGATICYDLMVDNDSEKTDTVKLEEIMAYTFSPTQFRRDEYIFHKDGDQKNCAWDNLVLCDLSTLQELEITRLEAQHPGTTYTVAKNIHDGKVTFERYLVSDNGKVYSLVERDHIAMLRDRFDSGATVELCPDIHSELIPMDPVNVSIMELMEDSFCNTTWSDDSAIAHGTSDESDDSSLDLDTTAPSGSIEQPKKQTKEVAPETKQGESDDVPEDEPVQPQSSDSETIKWKTIGALPWNGRSYSLYEVSNMGEVRRIGNTKPLKVNTVAQPCGTVAILDDATPKRQSRLKVCQLVANAFVDGYDETRSSVKHLNGNKLDNRAENLEWEFKEPSPPAKNARRVIASLVDDPTKHKEFPSMAQAERVLNIRYLTKLKAKHGSPFTVTVDWEGEEQLVSINIPPS